MISERIGCVAFCTIQNFRGVAGISQREIVNSADPCIVETQINYLAKHLATKDNAHHPVYDKIIYIILYGVAIDTDQSVALHYVLTIDTDQVLSKIHDV